MTIPFRLIDTGVRDGRQQIALDNAMIELHKAGQSPDTIRFLRFPPTVLLGRHEAAGIEVRLDHCRANGIGLVRRITGGGAIYLDEGQVSFELLVSRARSPRPTLAATSDAIADAVAHGISRTFGIAAVRANRAGIEVGGRKLCGTVGYVDGDTLIYQGTVLVDLDPAAVYACLNRAEAGLGETRLASLKVLLGGTAPPLAAVYQAILLGLMDQLGLEPSPGELTPAESELARLMLDAEIARDGFVFEIDDPRGPGVGEAHATTPGGAVSAFIRCEGNGADRRIVAAKLAGDFFVLPTRYMFDLEAALAGVPAAYASSIAERHLAAMPPEMLTLPPQALCDVIGRAAREISAA